MLARQREYMGAAGGPETGRELRVELVAHPDDEGLEEGAGLSAGRPERLEGAGPERGPSGLGSGRRPDSLDAGRVDEGVRRGERVAPGAAAGPRRQEAAP